MLKNISYVSFFRHKVNLEVSLEKENFSWSFPHGKVYFIVDGVFSA